MATATLQHPIIERTEASAVNAATVAFRTLSCELDWFAEQLGVAMKAAVIGDYFNPCRLAVVGKSVSAILTCKESGASGKSLHINVRIEFVRKKTADAHAFLDQFDNAFASYIASEHSKTEYDEY